VNESEPPGPLPEPPGSFGPRRGRLSRWATALRENFDRESDVDPDGLRLWSSIFVSRTLPTVGELSAHRINAPAADRPAAEPLSG
jgi:hypothetical protein